MLPRVNLRDSTKYQQQVRLTMSVAAPLTNPSPVDQIQRETELRSAGESVGESRICRYLSAKYLKLKLNYYYLKLRILTYKFYLFI